MNNKFWPFKNKSKFESWHSQTDILLPEIFDLVSPFTMTSSERINGLIRAIRFICSFEIEGDIVECGVWRGGSIMAMAHTLQRLNVNQRKIWLFDTFEGMTSPGTFDIDLSGKEANDLLSLTTKTNAKDNIWCYADIKDVSKNVLGTGYPKESFQFIKGKVEDTLLDIDNLPKQIAILRLDTDWYESTKIELEVLYHKITPGGIIIIDDYGHWKGAKKAVDEFIADLKLNIKLFVLDYTGRIFQKPLN